MSFVQNLVLFLATATLAFAANPTETLADVKTVFVTPLEGQDGAVAEMVHAKLIAAVSKIHGISVVEEVENADAILTGSGLIKTGTTEYGHNFFHIQGGMRLVSKEGGVVLWADNISSNRYARSASSSFAESVAKSLGRILAEGQKK